MPQNEKKDWSKEISGQIAVYKTDKALLELYDSLKAASSLFPAHIHATGEKAECGERSLIRMNMLDYSEETQGNTVKVFANISPEETKYIYSALFCHLPDFNYQQEKIFGTPDEEGYSIVTNYPWYVEIQNGRGMAASNANGGTYCRKDSYICDGKVKLFLSDRDMFTLFCKAYSYIQAFELEYAFRQNRVGNFASLYKLLQKELQEMEGMINRVLDILQPELTKAA